MSKFANKFFYLLNEQEDEEIDALNATPDDDAESFKGSLDNPDDMEQFAKPQAQPSADTNQDLNTLQTWIDTIDEFKNYLNGNPDSILSKFKVESRVGTIFDDLKDNTKTNILDIAERLAALNEQLRSLYIEKSK